MSLRRGWRPSRNPILYARRRPEHQRADRGARAIRPRRKAAVRLTRLCLGSVCEDRQTHAAFVVDHPTQRCSRPIPPAVLTAGVVDRDPGWCRGQSRRPSGRRCRRPGPGRRHDQSLPAHSSRSGRLAATCRIRYRGRPTLPWPYPNLPTTARGLFPVTPRLVSHHRGVRCGNRLRVYSPRESPCPSGRASCGMRFPFCYPAGISHLPVCCSGIIGLASGIPPAVSRAGHSRCPGAGCGGAGCRRPTAASQPRSAALWWPAAFN